MSFSGGLGPDLTWVAHLVALANLGPAKHFCLQHFFLEQEETEGLFPSGWVGGLELCLKLDFIGRRFKALTQRFC